VKKGTRKGITHRDQCLICREMGKSEMERQAQMRKEVGNECFKKDKLGAAIDSYTEVISLSLSLFPN
jgi:hypothetical protein